MHALSEMIMRLLDQRRKTGEGRKQKKEMRSANEDPPDSPRLRREGEAIGNDPSAFAWADDVEEVDDDEEVDEDEEDEEESDEVEDELELEEDDDDDEDPSTKSNVIGGEGANKSPVCEVTEPRLCASSLSRTSLGDGRGG